MPSVDGARANAKSFGAQWRLFDHSSDRAWGGTPSERLTDLLGNLERPPEWLNGKRVLDAGCGTGVVAGALSAFGCEVVGLDVSESIEAASEVYPAVRFIQGDVLDPPFPPAAFDLVVCGGVLHHTPDPEGGFAKLARLLRDEGVLYVWLYRHVPGARMRVRYLLRRGPLRWRQLVAAAFSCIPRQGLTWRERRVIEHDFFTPRWRSLHTPDEVAGWCERNSLKVERVVLSRDGFAVVATA